MIINDLIGGNIYALHFSPMQWHIVIFIEQFEKLLYFYDTVSKEYFTLSCDFFKYGVSKKTKVFGNQEVSIIEFVKPTPDEIWKDLFVYLKKGIKTHNVVNR